MSNGDPTLEVLIQIREELAGLNRTKEGLKEAKKEANSLGQILRQGLGIGTGMELASSAIRLLREGLRATAIESVRLAGEIKTQSEALGVTTEAYQVLRQEFVKGGLDAGRMTMAMQAQVQSMAAAREGAGTAAQAYRSLGLTVAEIERLSPQDRLITVARAVESATDRTRAFQAAGQLLGQRNLPQLLNALQNLAKNGYDNVANSARRAGQVMTEDTVMRLDAAKEAIEQFQRGVTITTGETLAAGMAVGGSARRNFFGTAWDSIRMMATGGTSTALPLRMARDRPPPRPAPTATGPAMATSEAILAAQADTLSARMSAIQGNSLFTEREQRAALTPILEEQLRLYEQLAQVQFGEGWREERTALGRKAGTGSITEDELIRLGQLEEMETRIRAARVERLQTVDTPLLALGRELNDTNAVAAETLQNSVGPAMSSLTQSIWAAFSGTGKFRDAWKGVASVAGQALTDILVKLYVIRPLLSMLGFSGGGGVVSTGAAVAAAGGGTFLTRGPTNFTVGDNPGGVELVNVVPLSGVGRTTVAGRAMAMAGGGSALVAGAGAAMGKGDIFNFSYTFEGGVSREEITGMLPQLVQATKSAVLDAQRRRRDGFHS